MPEPTGLVATPADVGRRLVVRRVLERRDQATGRTSYGDVLGALISWEGGVLVLRTRDDRVVEIAESSVVAAKTIPPPPLRRQRRG